MSENLKRVSQFSTVEDLNWDKRTLGAFGDRVVQVAGLDKVVKHRQENPQLYRSIYQQLRINRELTKDESNAWQKYNEEAHGITEVWAYPLENEFTSLRCWIYSDSDSYRQHWSLKNASIDGKDLGIEYDRRGKWDTLVAKRGIPEELYLRLVGTVSEVLEPGSVTEDTKEGTIARFRSRKVEAAHLLRGFLDDPLGFLDNYKGIEPQVDRLMSMAEFKDYIQALEEISQEAEGIVIGRPNYGSYERLLVESSTEFIHPLYNPKGLMVRSVLIDANLEPNPYVEILEIPVVVERNKEAVGAINLVKTTALFNDKVKDQTFFRHLFDKMYWVNRWRKFGSAYSPDIFK